MPIGIIEAVLVHEAVVFWFMRGRTACREGFGNKAFHGRPTLAGKAMQRMANSRRVGDLLRSEHLELRVRSQHHINRVADDDAGGSFICECGWRCSRATS